jgi:hypothetical protein
MYSKMEQSIKDNGKETKDMDMGYNNGQMVLDMKAFGWTTKLMVKAHSIM